MSSPRGPAVPPWRHGRTGARPRSRTRWTAADRRGRRPGCGRWSEGRDPSHGHRAPQTSAGSTFSRYSSAVPRRERPRRCARRAGRPGAAPRAGASARSANTCSRRARRGPRRRSSRRAAAKDAPSGARQRRVPLMQADQGLGGTDSARRTDRRSGRGTARRTRAASGIALSTRGTRRRTTAFCVGSRSTSRSCPVQPGRDRAKGGHRLREDVVAGEKRHHEGHQLGRERPALGGAPRGRGRGRVSAARRPASSTGSSASASGAAACPTGIGRSRTRARRPRSQARERGCVPWCHGRRPDRAGPCRRAGSRPRARHVPLLQVAGEQRRWQAAEAGVASEQRARIGGHDGQEQDRHHAARPAMVPTRSAPTSSRAFVDRFRSGGRGVYSSS